MSDATKSFVALLNGIVRHDYYDEEELTDELLKQDLYPGLPGPEFAALINKARNVIKSMATSDMDQNQAETFLTSQRKKRDSGITEDQAKAFQKAWKTHRSRIHKTLVERCSWNNRLKNMSWRIDVQSRSRKAEQMNTASAIIEMQLEKRDNDIKESEVLRFEVDENGLTQLLRSLKDIEELIESHTSL